MIRRSLLRKLEMVLPAVATRKRNPTHTDYCFTGERLIAASDEIALSVPLQTEITGTVSAAVLTELVEASPSAMIKMLAEGDNALIKLGRDTTARLARGTAENYFVMTTPITRDNILAGTGNNFFAAVACCLQSLSRRHAGIANLSGITLIPGTGQQAKLFATDKASVTCCTLELAGRLRERVILSVAFCKQMLRLAKEAQTMRLAVRDNHALFLADDTLLFGRLVQSDNPLDYESVLQTYMPNGTRSQMVQIPKPKLGLMLQRAARICDGTRITVKKNAVEFLSRSERGEVVDSAALPGHPDIEVLTVTAPILKAYAWAEKILITELCVLMASGNKVHITATNVS